jgi:hypothetical protein
MVTMIGAFGQLSGNGKGHFMTNFTRIMKINMFSKRPHHVFPSDSPTECGNQVAKQTSYDQLRELSYFICCASHPTDFHMSWRAAHVRFRASTT